MILGGRGNTSLAEQLLQQCNLHTIGRLPHGVFTRYPAR